MRKPNDMRRCLTALEQDSTLIAVIELGLQSWLVAGIVPGIERHPLKKIAVNEEVLLKLLQRWCDEARKAGHPIKRICVAFEAGRDGFWLARWLRMRAIEAYAIHPTSVSVSREHRRAKTDRLDTELLKRAFIGWLGGETDHCSMAAIPTLEEEDRKRPNRERETLVGERTRIVNRLRSCLVRLGIRGFNPKLRKAAECFGKLRTPEGPPIPPNTLEELKRDSARLRLVRDQIKEIEKARLLRLQQRRKLDRTPWCSCWPAFSVSVSKLPTCWCTRCCRESGAIEGPSRDTRGLLARPVRVERSDARRGSLRSAMPACAEA